MKAIAVLCLFSAILLISCNHDNVTNVPVQQPPTITSVTPNKFSRGEQGIATIQGSNFLGATLVFLGNEITLQQFTVVNPGMIEVPYRVNPNAAVGSRPVQIITPAGNVQRDDLIEVINNRAPVAKFTVFPDRGATNTTYRFDAVPTTDQDGTIVSYQWDFGDNKKGQGPTVSHKYGKTGKFTVTLTVTDNDDATGIATANVNVREGTAPIARFSINPQTGDVNTTYNFNASPSSDSDGQITKYFWDFGNGNTASGITTSLNFNSAGTYFVTLTITDNDGLQNAIQKQVVVGAFDQDKAAQEIRDVVAEFFRRFALMPVLSAEAIVVNWSTSPDCPGRSHELSIIQQQQQIITNETTTPIGNIDVTFNSTKKAHAVATYQFDWTQTDGSIHTGTATHDFTFIFENGSWQICDFVVF
jgi:PKD repeat protein